MLDDIKQPEDTVKKNEEEGVFGENEQLSSSSEPGDLESPTTEDPAAVAKKRKMVSLKASAISGGILIALIISVIIIVHTCQNFLIYSGHYSVDPEDEILKPSDCGFGPKYDDPVEFVTKDAVKLHGYWIPFYRKTKWTIEDLPTIIYFQGNGGDMSHRLCILKKLQDHFPCNTFIFSYRGYGKSEGTPEIEGLRMDSQAALDHVLSLDVVNKEKIILFGQSIGGGVVFDLAARNQSKIYTLILENSFLSLRKVVASMVPGLGWLASRLIHQDWDSEARLKEMVEASKREDNPVKFPHMLFLAGNKDTLVEPFHMRGLHEIAQHANLSTVAYKSFDDCGHNDTVDHYDFFHTIQYFFFSTGLLKIADFF